MITVYPRHVNKVIDVQSCTIRQLSKLLRQAREDIIDTNPELAGDIKKALRIHDGKGKDRGDTKTS